MSVIGNAIEPMTPPIAEELETIISRLNNLRANLATLGDDFGVHLPEQTELPRPDRDPQAPGLTSLRNAITEINTQIALIEQQHERLYAARAQLFGVGDGQWQTSDAPLPSTPGNYGPVRAGDFRSH